MQPKFNSKLFLTVVATLASGNIYAQVWNYQTVALDGMGPGFMGQVSLEQVGGEYIFQMKTNNIDPCHKTPLKASVERTASTITITPSSRVSGCGPVRYVLNADGTGGFREFLSDGQWRREQANRVLTLRK